ncbi:hypothetical protein ACWJJH_17650 [Endozoicomonadaceae bacterium StTr2]
MAESYLEIVELPDGQIALRRSDEADNPLVTINFSEEARAFLEDNYIEVAKAMMNAALNEAGRVHEMETEIEEVVIPEERVLH